jgi:hypothetical protein
MLTDSFAVIDEDALKAGVLNAKFPVMFPFMVELEDITPDPLKLPVKLPTKEVLDGKPADKEKIPVALPENDDPDEIAPDKALLIVMVAAGMEDEPEIELFKLKAPVIFPLAADEDPKLPDSEKIPVELADKDELDSSDPVALKLPVVDPDILELDAIEPVKLSDSLLIADNELDAE